MIQKKNLFEIIFAITFGIFFAIAISLAWTEPSQPPPYGNIAAPLNVGPNAQAKLGGLVLNWGGATTGLIVARGNVGIGTITPMAMLDINDDPSISGSSLRIRRGNNPGGSYVAVGDLDPTGIAAGYSTNLSYEGNHFLAQEDDNIVFSVSGGGNIETKGDIKGKANLYVLGNVGIGKTAASSRLEIVGETTINPFTGNSILTFKIDNAEKAQIYANSSDNSLRFRTPGNDRMTILNNGNVGIGITNPSEKLTVQGNIGLKAGRNASIGTLDNYDLNLMTNSTTRVVISASGNVGIGVYDPINYLLDVNGDIGANDVYLSSINKKVSEISQMGPVFINPILVDDSSRSGQYFTMWKTFSTNILRNAKAVILEYNAAMNGPDEGTIDAYIKIRKDSRSREYILARGRSASDGDNVAWGGQGIFPIDPDNGSFQYIVQQPGFSYGWEIRLIGYYK
jgi:ethanolamine utilization microcompartment shell protein EutS